MLYLLFVIVGLLLLIYSNMPTSEISSPPSNNMLNALIDANLRNYIKCPFCKCDSIYLKDSERPSWHKKDQKEIKCSKCGKSFVIEERYRDYPGAPDPVYCYVGDPGTDDTIYLYKDGLDYKDKKGSI